MPFILKTRDIAVLLDMSPDDVNALARKGLIKGRKIGKHWRFRSKDVNKCLDMQRNGMISCGKFDASFTASPDRRD